MVPENTQNIEKTMAKNKVQGGGRVMTLNEAQKQAVKTIDRNLAVNAGAGTGKTKVLTERYIYILEHGNLEEGKEIESIVAITFTKKATQEMIHRIRAEIRKRFNKGYKWRKYYRDLEKANISTIHSFCAKILRECPVEANIDPYFEVMEDYQASKVLKEAIREVLIKGINEDEGVYKLLLAFGKDNVESLVKDFLYIYNKVRSVGISFLQLKEGTIKQLNDFEISHDDLTSIKDIFKYLMEKLPKNTKIYKLQNNETWIKFFNDEYNDEELPEIITFLYDNIGKSTKEAEKIELLKEAIERVLLSYEKNNIQIYSTVLDLLIAIDRNYESKKCDLRALDYDDLQIRVLKLLDDEAIRKRYQDKFKYIMVDEFQDTNELQKNIFYKLASVDKKLDKSNLFVVGDPKQSIYGFRGADLDVFYDVIDDIEEVSKAKPITLDINYRTVNTVLGFINDIFLKLMANRYNRLSHFRNSANQIDIEILENEDLIVPEGVSPSEYHRIYESQLIAKRIKELVLSGKYKYGDFAILFRASTRNHIYEEALKRFGIPFYNFSGKGFFEQREILDLINAFKAISNPFDTIATVGFLRSPMIGLSDKTLYWILRYRETTVYESMKEVINRNILKEEEKERIIEAIELMEYLFEVKHLYGLEFLVNELISKTFFVESMLLKHGGKQAVANIYKFIDLVREYEKDNIRSLEDFIDYLDEIKDMDEAQEKIYSEDSNVVKILTIHKSKGLQFPVVIIPELCSSPNTGFPNIIFSKNLGIGIETNNSKVLYNRIKKELAEKEKEEMERVLYVAMTRAEDYLILGFQGKDTGYKKLIKELIDYSQCKKISQIDMEGEEYKPINLIEDELLTVENMDMELPLLVDMPEKNKKIIERYSISQYLVFRECKRRFFLDYYRKLASVVDEEVDVKDDKYLDGIEKGNIVHKFCEHYRLGVDGKKLLERLTIACGIPYTDEIYEELKVYIDNYIMLYREDYERVYMERPFYLKIKDYYITGIIDRINIHNGKAEILDYKTNKIENLDYLVYKYTPQLQLYAYVVKEIMNIDIERASIILLENGQSVDIPIDQESLINNLKNLEDFMDFVSNNSSILDYNKANKCNHYCKHRSFCDLE
ncbi:MAG: UvrD-helicase domain-containing protein [Tissierellia bacterium]|nr:UvrD-helicase domain-containing protein [Tissierellia bacterium]